MAAGPRIEAHDASRIEWSVYVPLPDAGDGAAEVDLSLEVPENVHAPHDGWEQFQLLARLSTPDEDDAPLEPSSVDDLRRAALGYSRKLKLVREALPRAHLAHALHPLPLAPSLLRDLGALIDRASAIHAEGRERLTARDAADPPDLSRERALADEFLSGQLLELLAVADESCGRMLGPAPRGLPGYRAAAAALRARVAGAMEAELAERARRGYPVPEEGDALALSAYLERKALLKKHFQGLLFLEPEVAMVDQEARNLVALCGAATAFLFYLSLQALQSSAAARAGLGVGTVVTLGAFAYALKDRMKELTRQWLSGKLSHLYANRLLTLRAPARLDRKRPTVLQARETFTQTREARPDALNPAAGETARVVVLRYRQRIKVKRAEGVLARFSRVKLVCRYDLSPLLPRLDDSVKRVPVPGYGNEPVRFADAPRIYRLAVQLRLRTEAGESVRSASVLLQRAGIAAVLPAAGRIDPSLAPPAEEPGDVSAAALGAAMVAPGR